MARWHDFAAEAPDLAEEARRFLDAHRHKTIATLRRSGAPRLSGIEVFFVGDDLWFGSMWRAQKALDLRRDPRFALHSGSDDPPTWRGDVSISGIAEEVEDDHAKASIAAALESGPGGDWHLFRADVTEVVAVRLTEAGDRLELDIWNPGSGVRRTERR